MTQVCLEVLFTRLEEVDWAGPKWILTTIEHRKPQNVLQKFNKCIVLVETVENTIFRQVVIGNWSNLLEKPTFFLPLLLGDGIMQNIFQIYYFNFHFAAATNNSQNGIRQWNQVLRIPPKWGKMMALIVSIVFCPTVHRGWQNVCLNKVQGNKALLLRNNTLRTGDGYQSVPVRSVLFRS